VRPSCRMLPSLLQGSRASSLSTFSRSRFFGSSLLLAGAGVGSLMNFIPSTREKGADRVALLGHVQDSLEMTAVAVDDRHLGGGRLALGSGRPRAATTRAER